MKIFACVSNERSPILVTRSLGNEWNISKKRLPIRFWNTNEKEEKKNIQASVKLSGLHENAINLCI